LKTGCGRKVNNWEKHLSKVGREILVKFVVQTILTCYMNTFLLLESLAEDFTEDDELFLVGLKPKQWWMNKLDQWKQLIVRKECIKMGF